MGNEFAGHHALIDGTQVDAGLVAENGADVVAVEQARQDAYIIQIKFQQIFSTGFQERKDRGGNGPDVQGDARADQIVELILIIPKALPLFPFDAFGHHALFLVFHVGRDEVIDPANFQFLFLVIFGGIGGVIIVDLPLNFPDQLDVVVTEIGVHRVRQAAHQQVLAEKVHHLVVRGLVQRLPLLKFLPHG